MDHYFIDNPDLTSHERILELELSDTYFSFVTNTGLFSNKQVDRGSVRLLKNMPPMEGGLLDMCCGYGVLGIVLAKINPVTLTMSDINLRALTYAKLNADRNKVQAEIIHSNCFEAISGKFDHIVLNPPIRAGKEVVYRLYNESISFLSPGGSLYVIVFKQRGAKSSFKALSEIYPSCEVLDKSGGYYVIQCAKM